VSIDACAALVARADPDRWAAVLAAPIAARPALLVLYAYNIEVSRAPWVSSQSLICEMRLQWWRDVLAQSTPRAHEVALPLHELIENTKIDRAVLDAMAGARVWDVYSDPFESADDFDAYIDATSGGLVWACAQALGAGAGAEGAARAYGYASGLAAFLRAVPDLAARGRLPLRDDSDAAIAVLAQKGLEKLHLARSNRREIGSAWPAMLAGVQAGALLRLAHKSPALVRAGGLHLAPAPSRARLIWASITQRV
jgi:15-cis-phytoene synthase